MTQNEKTIYTLIPLAEFKALLGIDDREDKLSLFCLVTSTFTIEQYCKRRLLQKKIFERIEYTGYLTLPMREYKESYRGCCPPIRARIAAKNSSAVAGSSSVFSFSGSWYSIRCAGISSRNGEGTQSTVF